MPKKTAEEKLKNHLKMIAKEKYVCSKCKVKFRYKNNYILHLKKCYPLQVIPQTI